MALPRMDDEDADHLAEDLADLGRGDEIAGTAEGLAGAVIAVFGVREAEREIIGDADRAVGLDNRLDLFAESGGHVGVLPFQSCSAAWRRARSIAQRPSRIIGEESTMPMVSQFVPRR